MHPSPSQLRVTQTIRHQQPDRMPVYGWIRGTMDEAIIAAYGSLDAFEDRFQFDLAHLFGGAYPYWDDVNDLRASLGGTIEPDGFMQYPIKDPNQDEAYNGLRDLVKRYKHDRGRFLYVQTPGIFECLNGVFGFENHLMYLMMYPDDLRRCYRRHIDWCKDFAVNCLSLGIDMIHVSDDWGSQESLLFSPDIWWDLIFPFHKELADHVHALGGFVSLHSDGNIMSVLDGVEKIGYDVVHPIQESAGMRLDVFRDRYRRSFTMMGGIDVQTELGFNRRDRLRERIARMVDLFRDGGLILCTSHMVQDHCSVDELTFAYETVRELVGG